MECIWIVGQECSIHVDNVEILQVVDQELSTTRIFGMYVSNVYDRGDADGCQVDRTHRRASQIRPIIEGNRAECCVATYRKLLRRRNISECIRNQRIRNRGERCLIA